MRGTVRETTGELVGRLEPQIGGRQILIGAGGEQHRTCGGGTMVSLTSVLSVAEFSGSKGPGADESVAFMGNDGFGGPV